jgi:hypothetical protein
MEINMNIVSKQDIIDFLKNDLILASNKIYSGRKYLKYNAIDNVYSIYENAFLICVETDLDSSISVYNKIN